MKYLLENTVKDDDDADDDEESNISLRVIYFEVKGTNETDIYKTMQKKVHDVSKEILKKDVNISSIIDEIKKDNDDSLIYTYLQKEKCRY